jgi:hypothetical protein
MVRRILQILKSARQRKAMYLPNVDVASAETFLSGFEIGCSACGFEVPLEVRKRVTTLRGWEWRATSPVDQMRERGVDEERIVEELFALEIAAWEMCRGD